MTVIFVLLGSGGVKAACKMLLKLTPDVESPESVTPVTRSERNDVTAYQSNDFRLHKVIKRIITMIVKIKYGI